MSIRIGGLLLAVSVLLALLPAAPAEAQIGTVLINEIESSGGDPGDWVELHNPGSVSIDIAGYIFKDDDDSHEYIFPAASIIAPGGFLVLDKDVDFDFGLGGSDSARLFSAGGVAVVDTYSWTEHAAETYGRCPDGTGAFATTAVATKGSANSCAAAGSVIINEVVSSGGDPGDWIELHNPGVAPIDIGGYIVVDDKGPADGDAYTVPANTVIAAGGYLVLDKDDDFQFGLGGGDAAQLFAPDGTTLIDSHTWTEHGDPSYGRCPNASGAFTRTGAVTKGAANDCAGAASTVVVNEVESSGGDPDDWAELFNTGAAAVDIGGWMFIDNDPTHTAYVFPVGTMVPAGGFYVIERAMLSFGLGSGDSARLLDAGGLVIDEYSWSGHATTTYGRCPDGTGDFSTTLMPTKGAANACGSAVLINEVESSGGDPDDWVEFYNPTNETLDLSGFEFRDDDDTHSYLLPAGTTIGPFGFLVLDKATFDFGLGGSDSARIFAPGGVLVDSYTWADHAPTTFGRCPDGEGFATTVAATKGSANQCPGLVSFAEWPGGSTVTAGVGVDAFGGDDISGASVPPTAGANAATPAVLWVSRNSGTLYRLLWNGTAYVLDPANDWGAGKALRFPDGVGVADAEGVTAAGTGAIYVASERDNNNGGVSRNSVLQYDPAATGTVLTAVAEWNLTSDLPSTGANAGAEGIAWIPDSALTAGGFVDQATGQPYSPALYPGNGGGILVVSLESSGDLYAYALTPGGAFTRVGTFSTPFASVMGLEYDASTGDLWAVCDDGCQGRSAVLRLQGGTFAVAQAHNRPSGMANINNEGFAIGACEGGTRTAIWTDDNNTDLISLRLGTLSCSVTTPDPVPEPTAVPQGGEVPSPSASPTAVPAPTAEPQNEVGPITNLPPEPVGAFGFGTEAPLISFVALPQAGSAEVPVSAPAASAPAASAPAASAPLDATTPAPPGARSAGEVPFLAISGTASSIAASLGFLLLGFGCLGSGAARFSHGRAYRRAIGRSIRRREQHPTPLA